MNEQDLPSDSDESDFEYKPSDEENCIVSEEDESGEDEGKTVPSEDEENGIENKNKKKVTRKPGAKRKSRKRKIVEEDYENEKCSEEPQEKKLSVEEEKKKTEALWEDFLKDTGGRTPSSSKSLLSNTPEAKSNEATNGTVDQSKPLKTDEKENKVTVTQIFEFAGEKIKVQKEVPAAAVSEPVQGGPAGMRGTGRGRGSGRGGRGGMGGALSAFVGQLGKKNKLSMLEKSKLDWDSFKKEEGIEDDLKTFNKGKDGYLERQDFLQRADLRQFEIEKQMRAKKSGR